LAHPDWNTPRPVAVWLHGRTVTKELDPGRYLRWIRAGIAACAIDLPGHGERFEIDLQAPENVLELVGRGVGEVDRVVSALREPDLAPFFDTSRMALGGMSAGGMITLRRMCDPHPFVCATVEAASGWLAGLLDPRGTGGPDRQRLAELDPMAHLNGWRPVPLLVLHSETDQMVPIDVQRVFVERLRERYAAAGVDPNMVELRTWTRTGARREHAGFGRYSNEAKNLQTEFLARHLGAEPVEWI
jgi:alpha-beta hydrolase superfamily lysophospholipase